MVLPVLGFHWVRARVQQLLQKADSETNNEATDQVPLVTPAATGFGSGLGGGAKPKPDFGE